MLPTGADLKLRPATIDDAGIVSDLETARSPDDARDPVMLRFWWQFAADEPTMRQVAEQNGEAVALVAAGHPPWETATARFGWTRSTLHPRIWSEGRFGQLVSEAESWLRKEGGIVAVARVRSLFANEIGLLEHRGYREVRRAKPWDLDLVEGRERLLAAAEQARENMRRQGVQLLTFDHDNDPDRVQKLYELTNEAEQDIPTTVPIKTPYAQWHRLWFENPSTRLDRVWIAREGDAIVGLSVIGYPPERGLPWTQLTATSRGVRGRGIARALKYETVAQAIELGVQHIRTSNDGENAPILHINAEMGYKALEPEIELHHELDR